MEKLNPYLKDVMSYIEKNVTPMPAEFTEVKVEMSVDSLVLVAYTEELYSNILASVEMKGGRFNLTEEDFTKYVNSLVKMRIDYVNGFRTVANPTERLVVPSYLSCVLSNIGRARHLDYGIELVPQLKKLSKEQIFSSRDDIISVSNALKLLKGIGFEYAEGFARSKEGSFDFMTMTLINGVIKNISKDPHPVYALLSSTLSVRGIESVLSPRISYGSETHLASLVRGLATLKV